MIRTFVSTTTIAAVLSVVPATSQANDLVNFLRAIQGSSRHYDRFDDHRHSVHSVGHDHRSYHSISRHDAHRYDSLRRGYYNSSQRSGTRVSFRIGSGYPSHALYTTPDIAPPPAVLPVHTLGQIVTCPVPLERHVNVHNAHEIAPGAVPVVIAVRNPHLGRFGSRGCVESLVYVQVYVPDCPPQRVYVSPCKTKIKLDYGRYEVEIESCNGHIDVEYDD